MEVEGVPATASLLQSCLGWLRGQFLGADYTPLDPVLKARIILIALAAATSSGHPIPSQW